MSKSKTGFLAAALAALALCSPLGASAQASPDAPLPVLTIPPRPSEVPEFARLDPSTGLHMTGSPQFIKASTWRLRGALSRRNC